MRGAITDWVARRYLRRPDQAELLRIKFPELADLAWGALNELAFLTRNDASVRLTTLNIEVTNRCNLACAYCPVNRDMARPKQDLPFELFEEILDRTPTLRTLLPFQWGEPLLHPRMIEMIRLASARGIRTYLTTNGTRLDDGMQRELLRSGLTRLTISVDGDDATHRRTRGVELAPIRERVAELRRRRDVEGSELRIDASMVVDESTRPAYEEFQRAWRPLVDRVQGIPRMREGRREKACREPWRGLLVVLVDGRVTTCCADSEGSLALGSVHERTPAQIFNDEPMRRLRRRHGSGCFPGVCAGCREYEDEQVSPRFH